MFLNSMFSQMMTKIEGEGPFGGSQATGVWRSFLTDEYSKSFAKAGGIGLAKHVYKHADRAAGGESEMTNAVAETRRAAPIETAAEAENLVRHLLAAMDALVATVEQETALVRAGKLKQAAALEPTKTELARLYAADTAQVKANLPGAVASRCRICSPRCASSTTRSTRCCRSISRCWRPRTRCRKA